MIAQSQTSHRVMQPQPFSAGGKTVSGESVEKISKI